MRLVLVALISLSLTVSTQADTLFTNVTVITMNGDEVLKNAYVSVKGDRIEHIGESLHTITYAPETKVINGEGKFLIPGLAEMHGHLPSERTKPGQAENILFLYLAGGVTTVRGMLGSPIQQDIRKAIKMGEIAGPTLYLAAPSLNGDTVLSEEDGIAKVQQYHADGWDLLKIHPGLTRAEYDAIVKTAHSLNMPFGGHVPDDVGIEHALASRQTSIEHMDGYMVWLKGNEHVLNTEELMQAVDSTRASDTWIVPTQALFNLFRSGGDIEALMARPENRYMPKHIVQGWERAAKSVSAAANPFMAKNRQALLKAFADNNVNIAMGSDAPQVFSVPGFSVWREIEVMVDAGLTPKQILKIGTVEPGRYFAETDPVNKDPFGKVAAGMRADLILLDKDPRLDATNLFHQAGVMASGRWYSKEMINTRLSEIATANQ